MLSCRGKAVKRLDTLERPHALALPEVDEDDAAPAMGTQAHQSEE